MDWNTGRPNRRFCVLRLLRKHFGPGDTIVKTSYPGPYVHAQAFISKDGKKKVLLLNKRNRDVEVAVPRAEGARIEYVDQFLAAVILPSNAALPQSRYQRPARDLTQ